MNLIATPIAFNRIFRVKGMQNNRRNSVGNPNKRLVLDVHKFGIQQSQGLHTYPCVTCPRIVVREAEEEKNPVRLPSHDQPKNKPRKWELLAFSIYLMPKISVQTAPNWNEEALRKYQI